MNGQTIRAHSIFYKGMIYKELWTMSRWKTCFHLSNNVDFGLASAAKEWGIVALEPWIVCLYLASDLLLARVLTEKEEGGGIH